MSLAAARSCSLFTLQAEARGRPNSNLELQYLAQKPQLQKLVRVVRSKKDARRCGVASDYAEHYVTQSVGPRLRHVIPCNNPRFAVFWCVVDCDYLPSSLFHGSWHVIVCGCVVPAPYSTPPCAQSQHGLRYHARTHKFCICFSVYVQNNFSAEPATREASLICARLKSVHMILTSLDGPHDNVIVMKPPLCFSSDDAARFVAALRVELLAIGSVDLSTVTHTPT